MKKKKKKNKVFDITDEEFYEKFKRKIISEEVVKTIRPKKTTIVSGGIYYAIRDINTKIINLKNCTHYENM